MLTTNDLKSWLHRDLKRFEKILLILASFEAPCQVMDIKARGKAAGLSAVERWNISAVLASKKGLAIKTPAGWELAESGKRHLRSLGVGHVSVAAAQVATDLRALLKKVKDDDTRAFMEEAIECYEFRFYRSAIVMSWLAAVHVLKNEIFRAHLAAFNTEASRVDAKWKTAKTTDDIGLMNEHSFLDRLAAISVIGKNVKDELQKCLKLRNACGHPSSLKVSTNAAANHLEILLLNVFQRFC